jgi:indole-3-glycerol phosphate synthase
MLYEARAYGADTVLLICAILEQEELTQLIAKARELGMEPLVEVANTAEMHRALDAGSKVIGVNNRNLHTFKVSESTVACESKGLSKASSTACHFIQIDA